MVKSKLKKYAVIYVPRQKGFAVELIKKGFEIRKSDLKNTQYINARGKADALKRVSARSYKQETGKSLYKKKKPRQSYNFRF